MASLTLKKSFYNMHTIIAHNINFIATGLPFYDSIFSAASPVTRHRRMSCVIAHEYYFSYVCYEKIPEIETGSLYHLHYGTGSILLRVLRVKSSPGEEIYTISD